MCYMFYNCNKIQILSLPWYRTFGINDRINFSGLYCKCVYSDGYSKIIKFPWLEYPEPELPGTYICKIYLDKKHTANVSTQFKFKIVDGIDTPLTPKPKAVDIAKKM